MLNKMISINKTNEIFKLRSKDIEISSYRPITNITPKFIDVDHLNSLKNSKSLEQNQLDKMKSYFKYKNNTLSTDSTEQDNYKDIVYSCNCNK